MKRKSSFSRILALVLTLALVLGALTISASAADVTYTMTKTSRTLTTEVGTTLGTVSVSSSDLTTTGVSDATWTGTNAATILVDLIPAATAATGTLTVDITPTGETTPTSTNVTVTNGEGIAEYEVDDITYTIVVQSTEAAYDEEVYGNSYIGAVSGEDVTLSAFTGSGTAASPYAATATAPASGYPFTMSLRIIPYGEQFNALTGYSYTVLDASDADLQNFVGTYFLAKYPANGDVLKFSVTYTRPNASNPITSYYAITLAATAGTGGTGLISYLPAPGQFTNEGVNTGGWGDAFISGSTKVKSMVGAISTTGVCLGYFGGYVVLDMGDNVLNSDNNMFGIDLIAYGNAFINNSEPGCIQVAQADGNAPGDPDKDGVIWYDIANSLYYDSDTATNASFTYEMPATHYSYNSSTSWPQSGTVTSPNASNNVPYNCSPYDALGATSGTVTYNTFHRHEWFPLLANYFVPRTTGSGDSAVTIGPLSGARVTDNTASSPTTTSGYPFAAYTRDLTNGSTMTLKGVMLKDATVSNNTSLYRFGMADVHPNNTTGDYYTKPYNPYAVTSSNVSSGNDWNSFVASAYKDTSEGTPVGVGDPIDISWAVYPAVYDNTVSKDVDGQTVTYTAGNTNPKAGQPAGLSNIRYVRIYTGAAKMNGIFGEISTEVCGVYKAVTGTGSGTTTNAPSVTVGGNAVTLSTTLDNIQTVTITRNTDTAVVATGYNNTDNVFVNETQGTGSASKTYNLARNATQIVRVIAKDTTTGLPYIGYVILKGN